MVKTGASTGSLVADVSVTDDGTNVDFIFDSVTYFSFNKTTKQMLISAGLDTDQTL